MLVNMYYLCLLSPFPALMPGYVTDDQHFSDPCIWRWSQWQCWHNCRASLHQRIQDLLHPRPSLPSIPTLPNRADRVWRGGLSCQDIMSHPLQHRQLGAAPQSPPQSRQGESGAQRLGFTTRYYIVRRLEQRHNIGDTAGERRHLS